MKQLLKPFVRSPDNYFHVIWSSLICTICAFFMLQTVVICSFEEAREQLEQKLRIVYVILCTILVIDIPINFFKGRLVGGMMCLDLSIVSIKYLKGKFIIDVITDILLILSLSIQENAALYFRFSIFLRLYDVYLYEKVIFKFTMHSYFWRQFMTVCKILILQLFVMHIVGCLFYLVSYSLMKKEYYGTNVEFYWITASLQAQPIIQLSVFDQYLWSFYFGSGIISTIVIGDIIGKNPIQTAYILIFIFVGTFSEAYLFQVVVHTWSAAYNRIKNYIKNIQIISKFMNHNSIPISLQHQIQSFIEFKWLQQHYQNKDDQKRILQKLPKNIKMSIILNQFQPYLNKIQLFKQIPQLLLRQITEQLEQNYYFKCQTIINPFQSMFNLIFILKGITQGYFQFVNKAYLISNKYYQNKKVVGLQTFITQMIGKKMIKAKTRVVTLQVSSKILKKIIKKNLNLYQILNKAKHSILWNQNYKDIEQFCECCQKLSHSVINCPQCHFNKNIFYSYQQQNQRDVNGRNQWLKKSRRNMLSIQPMKIQKFESIIRIKKQKKVKQYAKSIWSRFHALGQMIKNEDTCLNIEKRVQDFEQAHNYQQYYPHNNIL